MAATKLEIVNRALAKLGSQRIFINDYDKDTGPIANAVRLVYDSTLEQLVRMHTWQCCKKQSQLAPYQLQVTIPAIYTGSDGNERKFVINASKPLQQSPEFYSFYPQYTNGLSSSQGAYFALQRTDTFGNLPSYYDSLDPAYTPDNPDNTCWTLRYQSLDWRDDSNYLIKIITKTTNIDASSTYTVPATPYYSQTGEIKVEKVTPLANWSCQHFIPPDAIRSFNLSSQRNTTGYGRYEVDWIRQGDAIYSNYTDAYLTYEGIPTVTQMDALFENAFVTLLACKLAVPVTGARELELSLLQEFNDVALVEARRINGFEQKPHIVIDSEWLQATYESSGIYGNSLPPFNQSSYGTFE